jgi:MFS family permease
VGAEWQAFLQALTVVAVVASAVLLGVLQVSSRRWRGAGLKEAAAGVAVGELLVPLLGGLVALMPGVSWRIGFLVAGGLAVCGLVAHVATYLRHDDTADTFDDRQVQWGLPLSAALCLSLVVFSCAPADWAAYVVAGLSVALVFSGTGRAWLLLAHLDRAAGVPPHLPTVSR